MKRLQGKITYANVVSTLCLALLVGGGTAYAASQLAPHSVGTPQIKREAVTPAKLSRAAKKTLTGAQGPAGLQGAKGERGERGERGEKGTQGEQGLRGPSDAVTKFHPGAVPWAATPVTVETLSLGAGSWVVTTNGIADNLETSPAGAECQLVVGGTTVDASNELVFAAFPQPGFKQSFALSGAATVGAGATAELDCASDKTGQVLNPSITAVQVGELKTE